MTPGTVLHNSPKQITEETSKSHSKSTAQALQTQELAGTGGPSTRGWNLKGFTDPETGPRNGAVNQSSAACADQRGLRGPEANPSTCLPALHRLFRSVSAAVHCPGCKANGHSQAHLSSARTNQKLPLPERVGIGVHIGRGLCTLYHLRTALQGFTALLQEQSVQLRCPTKCVACPRAWVLNSVAKFVTGADT